MAENSNIEWCDHTFNIVWGCQEVSKGCTNCYAKTWAKRHGYQVWGPAKTTPRRVLSDEYWKQPEKWARAARKAGKRARVFCSSMADVFEDHPTVAEQRERLWPIIEATGDALDWLLLTKRPENMTRFAPSHWADGWPDCVIAMTSVEDQATADERIPHLLRVPVRRRGLSMEPLLGPVDLSPWLRICSACDSPVDPINPRWRIGYEGWEHMCDGLHPQCGYFDTNPVMSQDISWIIVGGESGPKARPMHPQWVRSLRDQATAAGIAFHFKQWGEWEPLQSADEASNYRAEMKDGDGVRWVRVGKKNAGRMLDGRTWDEYPV